MAASSAIRERLLGGFVCFQLVMIPLANYIKLVPVRLPEHRGELNWDLQNTIPVDARVNEPLQRVKDWAAYSLARYSEASGQYQCWAMFAAFGKQSALPIVQLNWVDREPVELFSHFDPPDPTHYFYPPERCCRRLNCEYRTINCIFAADLEEAGKNPAILRDAIVRQVRDQRRSMTAYLRWVAANYGREHPECPPVERVELFAHVLPNPKPGDSRTARPKDYRIPVARWYPNRPDDSAYLPLESWDSVQQRYVRLETP